MKRREDTLHQDWQLPFLALVQPNHLLLHQALKLALRQNPVEVIQCGAQQPLSRAGIAEKHRHRVVTHASRDHFKRRGVELLLALEVVVKQRLVDACRSRDLLRAGSGKSLRSEFASRGLKNSGLGLSRTLCLGFACDVAGDHN